MSEGNARPVIDLQSSADHRNIPIQKVGIRGIRYPITVRDRSQEKQETVATLSLSVNLPHNYRGTHMSRFIEVLEGFKREVSYQTLDEILLEIKKALHAEESHVEFAFPYFMRRRAPVSGMESVMSYDCVICGDYASHLAISTRVTVPIHTLCPCSREMARVSAHNQRGTVTVTVGLTRFLWIEDIIEIAEAAASSPLYSLLKREDEKYVTEHAFQTPRFVEDVVREVALRLDAVSGLRFYDVEAENMESIHNHNAYAYVSRRFDEA